MKTFLELYQELKDEKYFERAAMSPLTQFGTSTEPMLGARLLPEILVPENAYTEDNVRYRTEPALDGTRYSPAQMQEDGVLLGSVKVELGNSDTARQLTGQKYEGLVRLLGRNADMEAIAQLIQWTDTQLLRPHAIKAEIQRWQAMVQGSVERVGTNGYRETVNFYTPSGHRPTVSGGTVGAPAGWYSDAYDPYDDILAGVQKLEDLGYTVTEVIGSSKILNTLKSNAKVASRTSRITVNNGEITSTAGRVTQAELDAINQDEGLPAFTKYNGGYPTSSGYKRYLDSPASDRDYLIILARTGIMWDMKTDYSSRVEGVDTTSFDSEVVQLENTFGYYALGKPAGMSVPGRRLHTEMQERKPIGMYGESYMTSFPVITAPDAIYVIQVLRPTA